MFTTKDTCTSSELVSPSCKYVPSPDIQEVHICTSYITSRSNVADLLHDDGAYVHRHDHVPVHEFYMLLC